MDKYEYKVRADEIRDLISDGKYAEAAALADTIDWSRVKKPAILCQISDLYKKNRRYDDAIELLLLAYDRFPGGKEICYSLCELYIKTNNVVKAVASYKEFCQAAYSDPRKYILQYKIYEMQEVSLDERIAVLEELKNCDYREKWAYTLAYLYHRVGLATKCVEECDELITWFGDGKYVYKAMELKMRHQPLDPEQQEKYDHRFDVFSDSRWDGVQVGNGNNSSAAPEETNASEMKTADNAASGVSSVIAGSETVNNVSETQPASAVVKTGYDNLASDVDKENAALNGQTIAYTPVREQKAETVTAPDGSIVVTGSAAADANSQEAIALSMGYTQVYHGMQPEPDIQVKQVDVGEYNTINLQKALAEGVAEVLNGKETAVQNPEIIKADTKKIVGVEPEKNLEKKYEPHSINDATVEIARVSGTFEATKTIPFYDIQKEVRAATEKEQPADEAAQNTAAEEINEDVQNTAAEKINEAVQNTAAEKINETVQNTVAEKKEQVSPVRNTSQIKLTQVVPNKSETETESEKSAENSEKISAAEAKAMSAQPPESLAEVLKQEDDGQLSLVIPEDHTRLARQITGQLSINDVMTEWNRMKVEREEANRKKFHEQVKLQTGEIFNEFEKEALNGVLESLNIDNQTLMAETEPSVNLSSETEAYEADKAVNSDDTQAMAESEDDQVEELTEIAEDTFENTDEISDAAAGEVTEVAPEEIFEDASEEITEEVPEEIFEDASEEITEEAPEEIFEVASEEITEEAPEENIEDAAEEISIEISEDNSAEAIAAGESAENIADDNAEEDVEITDEDTVETAEGRDGVSAEEDTEENIEESPEDDGEQTSEEENVKTRTVFGINETTELFIRKKNQKIAQKAAEDTPVSPEEPDDTRDLTDEEKTFFGPYVQNKESKKQLVNILDNVSMASYTGNIIITGGDDNDTSDLATNIMRDLKQTDSNFSGKVARTSARSLNNRKIDAVVKQLTNGALIIEGASALSDTTVSGMIKALEQENLGIIIALLDSERNMEKLLEKAPELESMFTARMNIKPLTKEQLADYAVKYAYDKEYSIDQMGMLALHKQIEAKQTSTHSVNVIEVKEIVDKAIEHVNRKTVGHFFDVFGGKRYDEEDMIILGEKDFRN